MTLPLGWVEKWEQLRKLLEVQRKNKSKEEEEVTTDLILEKVQENQVSCIVS